MLALAKDGFVVAERNRGFRVVEMSETDLDEISQIRLVARGAKRLFEVAKTISAGYWKRLLRRSLMKIVVAAAGREI